MTGRRDAVVYFSRKQVVDRLLFVALVVAGTSWWFLADDAVHLAVLLGGLVVLAVLGLLRAHYVHRVRAARSAEDPPWIQRV